MHASLRLSRWVLLSVVAAGLLVGGAYAAEGSATSATTSATLSTTLHLALSTTATKEVSVRLGETARVVADRCQPAKGAADDDPVLHYAAAGGGMYTLFFSPPDDTQEPSGPRRDALSAATKYSDPDEKDGVYLLPEAMRGKACGELCTLKVPLALDPSKVRTATVTLGMSRADVMRLVEPARNYADKSDLVLLRSSDGGKYLLVFAGEKAEIGIASPRDALAEILYRPGDAKEGLYLFPRAKRGAPVPAEHTALLAAAEGEDKPPEPERLVFSGTIQTIEAAPLTNSQANWEVTFRVDKVTLGTFSGKTFSFRIHSPARSGVEVRKQYVVEAVRTDTGYWVDETQWMKQMPLRNGPKR